MSVTAYLGLGSNLGDRAGNIQAALERLGAAENVRLRRSATVIETDPVGPPQPKYLNTVAEVETDLSAEALLACCLSIETELGRNRTAEVRWGPRRIDIDLLLFGDRVVNEPGLTIPHPQLHERRFVLEPLAELTPDARHPLSGLSVREMLLGATGD